MVEVKFVNDGVDGSLRPLEAKQGEELGGSGFRV